MSWIGVALLLALPAAAQQGTTELRGRVVDSQGGVLPGVTVTVRNQATGMFRETVSNADGTYFVGAIVPGMYEISAELQGFKKYTRPDVRLEIGKTATVEITLSVGSLEETVNVTAETPLVDVTSKEVGGNIEARDLVQLPSVNRNFIGFIGLLPGIVPNISTESFGGDSVNVNGGDDRYNNYLLDGAANNDDVIGQRAGMQARTALESIQEFQVLTGQFDAEFGRTTGAVINAVTKQGTNEFRGSAFGFFQDASLTQPGYFVEKLDLEKPDTQQQQFGGTLGGPIVKDKAHFFASVERTRIDDGVTINVPSHPEFNATTAENTRVWNTVVRFDHQVNANNTWGVRWLRESSPQRNQIIGDVTLDASREEFDVDQTIVGTMNSVLASNKVNTVRVGFTREDVAFANPCFNSNGQDQAACEPTLAYQNFTTQQNATAQSRVNNAYQLEDTFGWFIPGAHGDHDMKFGVQYEYVTEDFSNQGSSNGVFSFATDRLFDPNDPSTYPERFSIRVPGPQQFFQKGHYLSLFGQDKWRMNSKLTLSLGLRYDLDILPISEADNPFFTMDDYPVDGNNFAPRVGFAYDLGDGRTVLHGGYGLFYNSTRVGQITGIISDGQFSDSFTVSLPVDGIDPGPESGQLPTSPFLVNGPVVNSDLLAQMFPPGSRVPNGGTFSVDNPDRTTQFAHETSIGLERQLAPNTSMTADYIHVATRGILMNKDLNPGLRATTDRRSPIVRIHPEFPSSVRTQLNLGETDYDALQLGLERRFSGFWSARVSYTLSNGRGNFDGLGTPTDAYQLLDDMRLDLAQGPLDTDRRHNFVFSGTAMVPRTGGLNVSWVARALSGSPFTLTDSTTDADRNGSFQEPLPSGSYTGEGSDAITVDFDSKRNGARGPGFFQLDLRLGYRLNLGGVRTLDLFGEIFNVTNRANFANPSGNRRSDEFLVLTDLRTGGIPRTGQLGVRFAF